METQLEQNKSTLFSYKEFCDFVKIFRKGKPELSKWVAYPLYAFFLLAAGLMVAMAKMSRSTEDVWEKYPSDKYRKVIKEGILWDSVEWHER